MEVRVNLGGGRENLEGFLNLDVAKSPEVEIRCDLSKSIPLQDNCVDEARASHFLEHLSHEGWVVLMHEIIRTCKPNAKASFIGPYYSYEMAMVLGHTGTFPPELFQRMATDMQFRKDLFGGNGYLRLRDIEYRFTQEGLAFCRKLGITPQEGARFLNNVAYEIKVTMKVIKDESSFS